MYISIENNDYTIKISTKKFVLGSGMLEYVIKEILSNNWKWWNFWTHDKLWYCDGSECLTCEAVNHDDGIIIFG